MKIIEQLIVKIADNISNFPLINHILFMIKLLRYLDVNPCYKIAILGKNSKGWIVTFWTAIFGKMPIIIIDINEPPHRILNILNSNQVYVLFVDKDIYKDKLLGSFKEKLFYTGAIYSVPYITAFELKLELLYSSPKKILGDNFEDWAVLFNKIKKLKQLSQLEETSDMSFSMFIGDFKQESLDLYDHIMSLNNNHFFEDHEFCIKSFSPGVTESETYQKGHEMTLYNLQRSMNGFWDVIAASSNSFDKKEDVKISTNVNFSMWFPFLVGLTFLRNIQLIFPNKKDIERIWVYDTVTFETMWREEFEKILQIVFYRNLFLLFPFLYRRYIKKQFYKVFGNKVKSVVILNCQVRDNIMYHLDKCNLPIIITAGSVKNNYIRAYECRNIYPGLKDVYIRRQRNVVVTHPDKTNLIKLNLADIESIIKSVPFVTNCIVSTFGEKFHAMIELDQNIYDSSTAEARAMNVLIFRKLKEKINKMLIKRIGIEVENFSFVNNLLENEQNIGYFPKALNGMPKLVYY